MAVPFRSTVNSRIICWSRTAYWRASSPWGRLAASRSYAHRPVAGSVMEATSAAISSACLETGGGPSTIASRRSSVSFTQTFKARLASTPTATASAGRNARREDGGVAGATGRRRRRAREDEVPAVRPEGSPDVAGVRCRRSFGFLHHLTAHLLEGRSVARGDRPLRKPGHLADLAEGQVRIDLQLHDLAKIVVQPRQRGGDPFRRLDVLEGIARRLMEQRIPATGPPAIGLRAPAVRSDGSPRFERSQTRKPRGFPRRPVASCVRARRTKVSCKTSSASARDPNRTTR